MNISKINFINHSFGIKFGPKLEDEINLKRLHIKSLPNSRRHISLNEYDKIINQIKKTFPQKNGSPTTVEIVDRKRDDRYFDGYEYVYCGYKNVPGYKITNETGGFKYFFNRNNDGKEFFDKYKTLLTTLKKLEDEDKKMKKDPLAPYYVNPNKFRKEFSLSYYEPKNNKTNDNDEGYENSDGDDDDDEDYIG